VVVRATNEAPVVHDNGGYVNVSAGCMDEMVPSDGQSIPISHGNDDFQFGTAQFDTRGESQSAAMQSMKGVKVHIPRNTG
jgi:hypothetical protein